MDCSPTNRERELGLDRRDSVVAIVILLSTRGTADSDNWHLHLPEKTMVRSYHLLDYD
ncbi:unnamed protein product [Porites lobata]|uniref:Uncharacterized protein n=1 Tax=Porites lobata TaxID=104759 RepID=A0ABN8S9D7_9CNID|nr:unnamed protein product [Porites lobata]